MQQCIVLTADLYTPSLLGSVFLANPSHPVYITVSFLVALSQHNYTATLLYTHEVYSLSLGVYMSCCE